MTELLIIFDGFQIIAIMKKLICLSISFLVLSVFCLFAQGELNQVGQKSLVEQTEESTGGLIKNSFLELFILDGQVFFICYHPLLLT